MVIRNKYYITILGKSGWLDEDAAITFLLLLVVGTLLALIGAVVMYRYNKKRKTGKIINPNSQLSPPSEEADLPKYQQCPFCKEMTPSGFPFCSECGIKIEQPTRQFCVECGTLISSTLKFCTKCGNEI